MASTTTARPAKSLFVALIAALAAVGILGGVLIAQSSRTTTASSDPTAQVAGIQQACQRWLEDGSARPDQRWCSDMAEWMSADMHRQGTGPHMLWADPDRMRMTCRRWLEQRSPGDAGREEAEQWCDDMVDWMREHMRYWSGRDHWDDWMRHGPMMRR